jgi:hypothetical protein
MVIEVLLSDARRLEVPESAASSVEISARLERYASDGSIPQPNWPDWWERMCVEGCANAVLTARATAQIERSCMVAEESMKIES